MDPEAVRRSLEPTASAEEITGSTPARLHFYDPFVLQGVSIESSEHGRLLCSFVVAPRHASPAGYLRSGVTATLADQLGSAVFYCSGLPRSGVSVEISVSFVDVATVGVRPALFFSRFTFQAVFYYCINKFGVQGIGIYDETGSFMHLCC
uniref:Thioesterase domain-containing protein n=1 Tax=Setaria viridis TaxID=4556 RepID=A0A4U6TUK7_SETVI|nr:hypothetical protein SEVIR_7G111300v2 [Setaria viridis]